MSPAICGHRHLGHSHRRRDHGGRGLVGGQAMEYRLGACPVAKQLGADANVRQGCSCLVSVGHAYSSESRSREKKRDLLRCSCGHHWTPESRRIARPQKEARPSILVPAS
eukprot:scaffold7483_cov286-Pinguiococcus_pyrenoidosus.AAC.5